MIKMQAISNNRIGAIILRFTGFALVIIGIVMSMAGGGELAASSWVFFTVQTNFMSGLMFLVLGIMTCVQITKPIILGGVIFHKRSFAPHKLELSETGREGRVAYIKPAFQMAFTCYITITMLIYWVILAPTGFPTDAYSVILNLILHLIVPIMVITDTLFFMPHGKIKYENAVFWLLYPIFYYIFVFVRAQFGGYLYSLSDGTLMFYPYAFLDSTLLSNKFYIIIILVGLAAFFAALGTLFIFIDRMLGKALNPKITIVEPEQIEDAPEVMENEVVVGEITSDIDVIDVQVQSSDNQDEII